MKEEMTAQFIIDHVGGSENIISVIHCATRLRFKLKDESIADTNTLTASKDVITVRSTAGQYQVVIGNRVSDVHKAILYLLEKQNPHHGETQKVENNTKKSSVFNSFIDVISGVFTPVLGVLAAAGMIKGVAALLLALNIIVEPSGTYQVLHAIGDALFYFFPIVLGYSTFKKFKGNPIIGMAIGAAMVYPKLASLTEAEILYTLFEGTILATPVHATFAGIPLLLMKYESTVIPIVIASFFGAKIERALANVIPRAVKSFMVPFLTLLIIVPITFIVIGPIATWLSTLLGAGTVFLYNLNPLIAGFVLAGLWQIVVMFGLHWGIFPLAFTNFATLGYDPILGIIGLTTFAQSGAVLGVILKAKKGHIKSLGLSFFLSGLFGITEPAIYGLTLPLKKPFIISCISSAIGGSIAAIYGSRLYFLGGLGIFGLTSYIEPGSPIGSSFIGICIAIAVSFLLSAILTYLVGFDEDKIIVENRSE